MRTLRSIGVSAYVLLNLSAARASVIRSSGSAPLLTRRSSDPLRQSLRSCVSVPFRLKSHVRLLWPSPPQTEQRCNLFLREVALADDAGRGCLPSSDRGYSMASTGASDRDWQSWNEAQWTNEPPP